MLKTSKRQLAAWRKLLTKKGRHEARQIIVEGARQVSEALDSGCQISAVLVANNSQGMQLWSRLTKEHRGFKLAAQAISPRDFESLTDTVHSAGIAAVVSWEDRKFEPEDHTLSHANRVLVCDRISDPGNLGTLIRTAAGLGVELILLTPGTSELTNSKTVRASAGAIFHVPVYEGVAVGRIISWSEAGKRTIFVADAHHGDDLIAGTSPSRWLLVVGGETVSVDPSWSKAQPRWVRLPTHRGVESLNAAIAGAIILDRLCRPVNPTTLSIRQEAGRRN